MRNFTLSEMLIVSEKERAARRIQFAPGMTVIEGPNDTGKSAILKSIYWALGAEPVTIPSRWLSAAPTVVLKCTVDNEPIVFLRKGRSFAAFDDRGSVLGSFQSITNELAPFLANVLGFALLLTNRQNELVVPTPAYMFLPFYLDQDISWTRQWSSFGRLQQFPHWRVPVIEYHVGIRDDRWYELEHGIAEAKQRLTGGQAELEILRKMRATADKNREEVEFSIDVDVFKKEVDALIDACNQLYVKERDIQQRYTKANEERRRLLEQAKTIEYAISELTGDRRYINHQSFDAVVECPTCGAEYDNTFGVRFSIAQDEARLVDFLAELKQDIGEVDQKLDSLTTEFREIRSGKEEIETILSASKESVTLGRLINTQGRHEFQSLLRSSYDETTHSVRNAETNIDALQRDRRRLNKENSEHKRRIERDHAARMAHYFDELNVVTLGEESLKLSSHISDSGSGQPRALLAYFFSVLGLIREYGSGFFAPVVIDEPNQQGQDGINMQALLEFIVEHRPAASQLVLGIESDHGVELPGERVHFAEKLAVLSRHEFASVRDEVAALLDSALA